MEIRIGVVHTPKEIALELEGSVDDVKKSIAKALSDDDGVLWLTDKQGRDIGIPSERVAYVEIEPDGAAKRVGFGRA
ncbi:MAG: DUF3107 domain-containing protein [Actinobacteria bacterium]|nr:DUF3107 domain-containing protein [Actinomycetota bacterium]